MRAMALWQKIVYGLGEALLVAGLLWGLYRAFIIRACPVGPFNDLTLIVVGLTVAVLPLHPFGKPGGRPSLAAGASPAGTRALQAESRALPYLTPLLRHSPPMAIAVWALALAGAAYSLWSRLTAQPGIWWFVGLIPAGLYFWFGISTSRPQQPARLAAGQDAQAQRPAPQKKRGGRDA